MLKQKKKKNSKRICTKNKKCKGTIHKSLIIKTSNESKYRYIPQKKQHIYISISFSEL